MLTELSRTPRLYTADDFVSPAEADHILSRGADVERGSEPRVASKHDYTGFSFEMDVQGDPALERLAAATLEALGLVNGLGTSMRFRRYGVDEYHPPHVDCYQAGDLFLVATALVYLTDTTEGGETVFPRARPSPITVRPKSRRLVAWFNYFPNGAPDPCAFHASEAVRRGGKATITNFIYAPRDRCAGRVR